MPETLVELVPVVIVIALILTMLGAGGYAVVRYLRERMAAAAFEARIADAPLTPLAKVRVGADVRVLARAHADSDAAAPSLTAPMSGHSCIAWQITLERGIIQTREHEPSLETWEVERIEESGNVVELHDQAAHAVLRLPGAEWRRPPVVQLRLQYELDQTDAARSFFARNGIRWEGYIKPLYRLTERVLEAGAGVCVFGQARQEGALVDGGGGGYRDAPAQLVFAAAPARPLVLLEAPGSVADAAEPAATTASTGTTTGGGARS